MIFESLAFLAFSAFTFWSLIGLALVIASLSFHRGDPGFLVIGFIIIGVLSIANPTYPISLWDWIVTHPLLSISTFLGYFGIGAIYSLIKWRLNMNGPDKEAEIKEDFKKFQKYIESQHEHNKKAIDHKNNKGGFISTYKDILEPTLENFIQSEHNTFNVRNNKGKIINWIVFWVPSLVWTVIHDLVEHIYNGLSKFYAKIANNKLSQVLEQDIQSANSKKLEDANSDQTTL